MPIVHSSFSPSRIVRSPHLQTIFPALMRRPNDPYTGKERLELSDGDFIDISWFKGGNKRLAIISHGLEGSSESSYVRGITNRLSSSKWDVAAWNMRGCSGEPNRFLHSYHSGKSEDLKSVVDHLVRLSYSEIALIGVSVGGNITLKYLGEMERSVPSKIIGAAVLSVPCDLRDSAVKMSAPKAKVYMARFLRQLKEKVLTKEKLYADKISSARYHELKNFFDFDARYTAPLNGFSSVEDYYAKASSLPYLNRIDIPTLIISALDDPFLGPKSFPFEEAAKSKTIFLEAPKHGGHVGFMMNFNRYWYEGRILEFLEECIADCSRNPHSA